jgi:hypothetical protein
MNNNKKPGCKHDGKKYQFGLCKECVIKRIDRDLLNRSHACFDKKQF